MYEWHYVHFIDELIRSGHTVIDCNPVNILGRLTTVAENSQILYDVAKKLSQSAGQHMLFAALATDNNLDPSAIDGIRAMGIPCVNFSVDDVVAPYNVRGIGKKFDLHWTTFIGTEKTLIDSYGCKVIYMPMAANPYFFKSTVARREHAMTFVGSQYGARGSYVELIAKTGVPIKVRGNGWGGHVSYVKNHPRSTLSSKLQVIQEFVQSKNGRKILFGAMKNRIIPSKLTDISFGNVDLADGVSLVEMVQLYASSTVSLGVLEVGNTHTLRYPLFQYRLREYETTMIGCAHIVRKTPELENSFEEDKEIIFYSTKDELLDKVKFYLSPERYELCLEIGKNARKRAECEHTWLARFNVIWEKLGIN